MGEAAPKPKASARKKKGDSASSTTPPTPTPTTTAESALRLSAAAKGKQPSRATTTVEPTDLQRTEAEQLKIILKRSRQETHISQQSGSGTGGARKKKGDSASSTTPPTPTPTTTVAAAPRLSATAKGKQPARATTPTEPTDVERTEAEQLKIVLKKSRQETHISQQRGSGIDERIGSRPGVLDVPFDDSEEELSWNSSDDEDVDEQTKGKEESEADKTDESDDGSNDGNDDDNDETVKAGSDKDDDEEELAKNDDEDTESGKGGDEVSESKEESDEEETRQEEEESFDPIPRTPKGSEDEGSDEEDQELRLSEEARIQEEEEADELYRDVNIKQGRGLQVTQNIKDSHVTLTPVHPDGPQESSSVSSFVTSMLNTISDAGVESIFTMASSPIVSLQTPTPIMTPSTIATITTLRDAPIPPTTIPSIILKNLPTFNLAFHFDERLRSLETTFSEYRQTSPFVDVVSAILDIVHQYMTQQMTKAVQEAVQIQTDRLQDSLQRKNDDFLRNIDENMKKIIKGQVKSQVKEQVSRILPRIEESVNATLEAEVLTRSSQSSRTSYTIAADLSEMELKKILIEKMEGNNEDERMMIRKVPPLDQTGGLKDEEKEGSMHQLALHLKQLPGVLADLPQGLNLDNCLPPLPLIPDNRGRRVIPFEHFINNDLEYLRGGASSRKYTTSFYGYAVNRESTLDVYSKRRIIAVTELKIVECHNYKHRDWILVRPDDDKIYKFKEGNFKRLRLQDIEDMLLLLVQGKLSNLTVEERFAFNVSLRMFTKSIVIQRRVEDLQLGVESYQKRLNLTNPDTYRPDLKRREAYIAYSNPRGFIYQNKDKKNILMRIDELHKFSDGTLNDVRNALDDRLKGIRMQYLLTTIWRRGDKDRAAAMI
nr:hypothetical protein [Tanacetum cinerariifolium]